VRDIGGLHDAALNAAGLFLCAALPTAALIPGPIRS
jgi:hypothetical protein